MSYRNLIFLFGTFLLAQVGTLPFKGDAGEVILFKQGQCQYMILSYVDLPKRVTPDNPTGHTPIFQSWWELPIEQRHFHVQSDYMRMYHYLTGKVYSVRGSNKYMCRYHIAEWIGIDPETGMKESWIQDGYR